MGGKLIIGVSDDGQIIGLDESEASEAIFSLQQAIYQSCTPPILPAVYTQRLQDKLLLIIEVSMGMNKPYFCTKEGLTQGTYVRIGAHTQKASPELISELQWQAKSHSLDELPIYQASEADLNPEAISHFLGKRILHLTTLQRQELLTHYKLLVKEHTHIYPSVAGIMLFGKNPQHFLSESFIICTHFKGILGREAVSTRDCTGNLFQQLDEALSFIYSRLNKEFVINKTRREEKLEVPEMAIRETVINALIHRNYQIHGPCKIAIFDDRIEIFSPGAFPGPLQIDQLELGITYIRNRVIARVFREAGLVEKLGSGFLTLFSSYRDYGLETPQVINGGDFVKCILPRKTTIKETSATGENRSETVMRLFNGISEINVQDVMQYCHVSRATASRILHLLVMNNTLEQIGKGPATRYRKR
jgi:ATP-dependent DNA helicase RecG